MYKKLSRQVLKFYSSLNIEHGIKLCKPPKYSNYPFDSTYRTPYSTKLYSRKKESRATAAKRMLSYCFSIVKNSRIYNNKNVNYFDSVIQCRFTHQATE